MPLIQYSQLRNLHGAKLAFSSVSSWWHFLHWYPLCYEYQLAVSVELSSLLGLSGLPSHPQLALAALLRQQQCIVRIQMQRRWHGSGVGVVNFHCEALVMSQGSLGVCHM